MLHESAVVERLRSTLWLRTVDVFTVGHRTTFRTRIQLLPSNHQKKSVAQRAPKLTLVESVFR